MFVEGNECTQCKTSQFTNIWKGRMYISQPEKSEIAKRIGIKASGEYAIKIR